jgi:type VI secretion system secreted protein VgrG
LGAVSNLTKQGLKMLDGKQCRFSTGFLVVDPALGAGFGALGDALVPEISVITSGRGSYSAITSQMITKQQAGRISNISSSTAWKMASSKQAEGLTGTSAVSIDSAIEDQIMPDSGCGCPQ